MSEHLYFGYSESVITPGRNIGLAGYAHRAECGFTNSGVLDDLYARALCLKVGEGELLVITLDLCSMRAEDADAIRDAVAEKTGVPVSNILLNLSHTHSGPVTRADYGGADANDADKEAVETYMANLRGSVVAICSEARSRTSKGLMHTVTHRASLGYNRRLTVKDAEGVARTKMLFSLWKNVEFEPAGPTDEDMPVLMIEKISEGQEDFYLEQNACNRVVLFNCPYHPVVMGQHSRYVSADYVGAARRCLEGVLGAGTKAMFLVGACGDTEPALATQYNPKAVEIVGNAIGYGIATALAMRKRLDVDCVEAREERVELDSQEGEAIRIQTLRIGDACIAAVSAECFTELGTKVRRDSPFQQTLVASNSNGSMGYLPTRKAFALEGYEIVNARRRGYDEGLFERVVSAIGDNLARLR